MEYWESVLISKGFLLMRVVSSIRTMPYLVEESVLMVEQKFMRPTISSALLFV